MIKKLIPFFGLVLVTGIFFWQFLLKGLLPIPADTIVGLYHPYRDLYSKDYPNGIPFKNFLITDPVRQQYPWRKLSIDAFRRLTIPTWNPYSFSGVPLLANIQSAAFYPLNILFSVLPFELSWSFLILFEPLLAGIFMFVYLKNLKLEQYSSFLGALVFAFSGFFTAWLEWGTVLHVALWLPLILLSIDKLFEHYKETSDIKNKRFLVWFLILLLSNVFSFFAGHLQIFFYASLLSILYFVFKWFVNGRIFNILYVYLIFAILFLILTFIQWFPALQFLDQSLRSIDQSYLITQGWFIPWQHLIQFIAPDFFGNPTTLNYWGTWNWGELTGYVGILPLILSIYAMFFRKDKKTLFFGSAFFVSLIFALPTPIAKFPYLLNIPFISTAQPTRLIFIVDFSLAVLSALGMNYLMKSKKLKDVIIPIGILGIFIAALFVFVAIGQQFGLKPNDLAVGKRNLIFPLAIFTGSALLFLIFFRTNNKYKKYIVTMLIILTIFDLFRFSWKFNTFSKKEYLYPSAYSINFIKNNIGNFRIATSDPRILPPNFSSVYKIQSVEGYDPLYLERYAQFISAINRNEPNINPPFGFNRIVRVENIYSPLIDLLGVKYVLSLSDLGDPRFEKVYEEGQTRIYENTKVIPRVFFAKKILETSSKQETINEMFKQNYIPAETAIIEEDFDKSDIGSGVAKIKKYSENEVIIETQNDKDGFLILTDSFYPAWHAKIDGKSELKIFRTDYIFRGVFVPSGQHIVRFYTALL